MRRHPSLSTDTAAVTAATPTLRGAAIFDLARFVETCALAMRSSAHFRPGHAFAYWRAATLSTAASWREALTSRVAGNVAAGLTVALVALPLNMALAIACGLPAAAGLVTGAIAGVLGVLLGGSRLQITGPEVALAPITFEILSKHGLEGLLTVTLLAGAFQIAFGILRVGRLVHAIPVPVIVGFLAAVSIMVLDSQLPVLLGVSDQARFVTELTPSMLGGVSGSTVLVGVVTIVVLVVAPKLTRRAPAPLLGLAVAVGMVWLLDLPTAMVEPIEGGFPRPSLPFASDAPLAELVGEAFALALIASIDSLLCAVSIDARTGETRTRTDQELVAQGVANIGSACFGGMPVAAAIVRSAAAVEAGASTRIAPLAQSVVLALVVVVFAPVVGHIPLVALGGILLVVGWRLIEWSRLRYMWRSARFEVGVLVATTVGILLTDFVLGVLVGVLASLAEFAHCQRSLVKLRAMTRPGAQGAHVMRLEGPLFFGSQAQIDRLFDDVGDEGVVIVDLAAVPSLDSSGASALVRAVERLVRSGNEVWLTALSPQARGLLGPSFEAKDGRVHLESSLHEAWQATARRHVAEPDADPHPRLVSQA